MHPTKVVLIGAASASFGPAMIADALLGPEMRGSELVLVDTDAERLEVMAAYARRVNDAWGAGVRITHTPDRTRALPDAEFVITAIAVRRDELWKLDFEIPLKHGIKQVLGENGGPGGLSHALRNIPILLAIAQDMERLCPDATLLNFTNPESRVVLALSRYTSLRVAGLCHGIGMGYNAIAPFIGVPADDLEGIAAGLNHFSWYLDLRRKSTGEDVYPLLWEADRTYDPGYYPLTRRLMRLHGLYPLPSDDHIGEYLSYAWEFCGLEGYDFARADARRRDRWAWVSRVAAGEEEVPPADGAPGPSGIALKRSGEVAFDIISAHAASRRTVIEAVNVPNNGLIGNLPDWAVVEVPALASRDGLRGVQVGDLPAGIAALLATQVHVQDLVVEAAVHGSRDLALQALLADPVVQSAEAAEKCLDELLATHKEYLPQFAE